MKEFKGVIPRALTIFVIFSVICGAIYTAAITGISQLLFPKQANGSIIEVDGKKYGSILLAQQYTDAKHLWGRVMKIDTSTFTDDNGNAVMYAGPSNLTPTGEDLQKLIDDRIKMIKEADSEKGDIPIPVDLVTNSGSGLDPHISVAAAEYQVDRIAKNNNMSKEDVQKIIDKYTDNKLFGILGERTVNVLEVNLALDGILK